MAIKVITLTTKGNSSGPLYNVFWSTDCVNYTALTGSTPIFLPTIGSNANIDLPESASCIKLVNNNDVCDNEVITYVGPPTTTTTTQCACVEFITLNVTTAGTITWNDCYGNPEMVTASIGLETIGSFGEECVNINTLGGTAVYTIDSYGPCCVPPATTTTTAGPTTTTTAGPTTTTTAGPTTTTTTSGVTTTTTAGTTTTTLAPTTTTTTSASTTCYTLETVQSSQGECFDCPGYFASTTDTIMKIFTACSGSEIFPPFDINVESRYSDNSTSSLFIPSGYTSSIIIATSDTQCIAAPTCGEIASPTFVSASIVAVSGSITECCI
jgi:hypothetical protein